jgi:hypothetical protein
MHCNSPPEVNDMLKIRSFALAAFLTVGHSGAAQVLVDQDLFAELKFDVIEKSIYLETRRVSNPSGGLTRMRVSEKGMIRKLIDWRGEPFALDFNGVLWELELRPSRVILSKISDVAIVAAGLTAYADIGFALSGHFSLEEGAIFTPASFALIFTGAMIPLGILSGPIVSNGIAKISTFGVLSGRNFFRKPVASDIITVNRNLDDYDVDFVDGSRSSLSALMLRMPRKEECENWLSRMGAR